MNQNVSLTCMDPEIFARRVGWQYSMKKFVWNFTCGSASLVDDHLCYFCLVFVMLSCASVYWCLVVWSPAGEGLTSWLSFVMSNCEVVTFPLVSWVRCGAWLYRFMIFTLFPTYNNIGIKHDFLYINICWVPRCRWNLSMNIEGFDNPQGHKRC